MRLRLLTVTTLLCGTGVLIAGCGSGTKVVSEKGSPSTASSHETTTQTTSSTKSRSTTTSHEAIVTATKTVTATSTRTSSAPAFEKQESGSQALQAAVATVEHQGYTPNETAEYHPEATLRVLTATKHGPGGNYQQRAFFFVDGRYIGTDASQPSASLKVLSQTETSITLGYGMYRAGDSPCCPSSQSSVRFQLDNGHLQAMGPIPPAHASTGLSRL